MSHLGQYDIASLPFDLSRLGNLGVAFFFVLSGFVLAWGTDENLPLKTFYRRRFARVYPSHLATLVIAALVPVVAVDRSWAAAISGTLMVQSWFRDSDIVYGMNGVSWSLSCEAFFYVAFPLLTVLVRTFGLRLSWHAAAIGLCGALVVSTLRPGLADHFPVVRATEFFLGVVAGLAFRSGWRPNVPASAAALVLVLSLALATQIPLAAANSIVAVPFLLLILHNAMADVRRRPGLLKHRYLIRAGEASFAFYLVHELVIVNLRDPLAIAPSWQLPVIVLVSLASAAILHWCVELPLNRKLRGPSRSLASPHLGEATRA